MSGLRGDCSLDSIAYGRLEASYDGRAAATKTDEEERLFRLDFIQDLAAIYARGTYAHMEAIAFAERQCGFPKRDIERHLDAFAQERGKLFCAAIEESLVGEDEAEVATALELAADAFTIRMNELIEAFNRPAGSA